MIKSFQSLEIKIKLYDIFFDLRKKINCTFIIVTHNQSLAKKADRQIILNDGRIIQ